MKNTNYTIKLVDFGKNLETTELAAEVRLLMIEKVKDFDMLFIDFCGVCFISNSFASECFVKFKTNMKSSLFKRKIAFINISDSLQKIIICA